MELRADILREIHEITAAGEAPTVAEISRRVGDWPAAVRAEIDEMRKAGLIEPRKGFRDRSIILTEKGRAAAGGFAPPLAKREMEPLDLSDEPPESPQVRGGLKCSYTKRKLNEICRSVVRAGGPAILGHPTDNRRFRALLDKGLVVRVKGGRGPMYVPSEEGWRLSDVDRPDLPRPEAYVAAARRLIDRRLRVTVAALNDETMADRF